MHLFVEESEWADPSKMSTAIISALKNGRGFMSNFSRGDAKGSKFLLTDQNGASVYPGSRNQDGPANTAEPAFPMKITAELTRKAKILLIRNGETIQSATAKNAEWAISETGIYRIEAYRGSSAWIYTNPFPVGKYPF